MPVRVGDADASEQPVSNVDPRREPIAHRGDGQGEIAVGQAGDDVPLECLVVGEGGLAVRYLQRIASARCAGSELPQSRLKPLGECRAIAGDSAGSRRTLAKRISRVAPFP